MQNDNLPQRIRHQPELTVKQRKIAYELGRGAKVSELAQIMKVSEDSIRKLNKREDFQKLRNDATAKYLEESYPLATKTLVDQLGDTNKWLAGAAAGRLLQLKATADGQGARQIAVVFASMPQPGSPAPVVIIPAEPAGGDVK